ncbi:hypothetical protein WMF27_10515 [Sorangium sp. So ce281]|uniref:hypothetical protein n=1 Tax=unclassified Sorangium TaxID=2621164 RepID=UPI003F6210F7
MRLGIIGSSFIKSVSGAVEVDPADWARSRVQSALHAHKLSRIPLCDGTVRSRSYVASATMVSM